MDITRRATAAEIGSATSVAVGAALGATIFPLVGPAGVVAIRQSVAAIATISIARPRFRDGGWRRYRPALWLGLVLVTMNLSLYGAISRVGLGLAVTLEFLGPLSLALLGSRRRLDLACAIAAGAGVILLTGTVSGIDPLGIGLGFAAGAAWAGYILLGQRAARSLPGISGLAVASLIAAVLSSPLLVIALLGVHADQLWHVGLVGLASGILCSALPYSIDSWVLRHLTRARFGMLQSLHPLASAVAGLLVLDQVLGVWQLVGIGLVTAANAVAVARPSGQDPVSLTASHANSGNTETAPPMSS